MRLYSATLGSDALGAPIAEPYGFRLGSAGMVEPDGTTYSLFSLTIHGPSPAPFRAVCSYSPLVTDAAQIPLSPSEWRPVSDAHGSYMEYTLTTHLEYLYGTLWPWRFVSKGYGGPTGQGSYYYQTEPLGFPLTVEETPDGFVARFLSRETLLELAPLSVTMPKALAWAHDVGTDFHSRLCDLGLKPPPVGPPRSRFEIMEDV